MLHFTLTLLESNFPIRLPMTRYAVPDRTLDADELEANMNPPRSPLPRPCITTSPQGPTPFSSRTERTVVTQRAARQDFSYHDPPTPELAEGPHRPHGEPISPRRGTAVAALSRTLPFCPAARPVPWLYCRLSFA